MKFAVIGGDKRSVLLTTLLLRDGHRVTTFAMEKASLPAEIPKSGSLQSCAYGADCIVLPVPAETGGIISAPYAAEPLTADSILPALWSGQIVCGGKLSEPFCAQCALAGIHTEDILRRSEFAAGNAALTAEGAIELLLRHSERSLMKSRVLIVGFGRIGKLLAVKLSALGAGLSVCARSGSDRGLAKAMGFDPLDYSMLEGELGDFDFIVNTVPARVLSDAMLCCISGHAVLLELASPPGGFDRTLAGNIGLNALAAPGLPGKTSPYSAAELIRDAVYAAIHEQEE